MTIHSSDPFATPPEARSPVRRLRARLPAGVTLWTAVGADGRRAGLTVSSMLVVDGDPGRVVGVVDAESQLWEALRPSGRFAVMVLAEGDGQLADAFAGLMPAPGGPFAGHPWLDTEAGPVLASCMAWATCRLDDARPLGWGVLIEATIDRIEIRAGADPAGPLIHYRGRYGRLRRAEA